MQHDRRSFTVMRAAFLSQRALANEAIIKRDPKAPALLLSRQAIEFATINGATVAHLDSKTGSLTPGKEADVIMLATDRINAAPVNNVPGTVVTLMDTSNVDNVFIAGKVAKFDGKLVGIDLNRVLADANKARDGVLQGQTTRAICLAPAVQPKEYNGLLLFGIRCDELGANFRVIMFATAERGPQRKKQT